MRTAIRLGGRAIAYEIGMWRSLYRWIFRRPVTTEPGAHTFGSSGVVMPIMWTFIAVSVIEVPILHLILPWPTVRTIAAALGVYGLFWMIGMLASMRVHPHVVGAAGLRIRSGLSLDLAIPWDDIAEVRHRYRSLPPGRGIRIEDGVQLLGVANQTSVDVVLREPTSLSLRKGPTEPVTEVRFSADGPNDLVAAARAHLPAQRPA